MAQLKSTKVFGDLNVTGEVNASTKITVNGEEVWDTGNLLNIGTTAATARTALGLGAQATRWPTFAEVTGKPSTYAPSGHTHPWAQVTGQPATATRWPTFAEVTDKPTNYATTWASVAAKPAQATRWPTWAEVTGKPDIVNSAWPIGSCYTQYPDTPAPADLFGGTWKLLFNNEGVFFRTEGGGASGFEGGVQGDDNKSHTHTASTNSTGAHTHTLSGTAASAGEHTHPMQGKASANASGNRPRPATGNIEGSGMVTQSAGAHTHTISGTAASAGAHAHTVTVAASGGSETRPKNRTIRVWQRTA